VHSWDVVGYTYKADEYCEDCIVEEVKQDFLRKYPTWGWPSESPSLDLDQLAKFVAIDRDDEHSYDTDDFPKVILSYSESGDTPDTCCKCGAIIESQWTGEAMDTVIEWAREYLVSGYGKVDYIEACIEYVFAWSDDQSVIVELFEDKLKHERNKQHEGGLF